VLAFTFGPGPAEDAGRYPRIAPMDITSTIRRILKEHGRLSLDADTLSVDADLYEAGMTSHASVNVMLALEGEFDIEFPDHMLKRSVFDSISSISAAVGELQAA
jgi:acyl carrier protein